MDTCEGGSEKSMETKKKTHLGVEPNFVSRFETIRKSCHRCNPECPLIDLKPAASTAALQCISNAAQHVFETLQ